MENLASYLKDHSLSQSDFAARIGVTQSAVAKYLSRTIRPDLKMAILIETVTGGKVPANGWDFLPPSKEAV